jgi:GxxExxY protein
MNTDKTGYCNSLTERVLSAAFEVSNTLAAGFLEKVHERALLLALTLRGLRVD